MGHALSKSKLTLIPFKKRRHIAHCFSISKNGVITGAADNDPATIATFVQIGALVGMSLTWLLAIVTPLAIAIEETSAKIGIVTHKGLAGLIKQHYGIFWAAIIGAIVVISNTLTIGADIAVLAEITGDFLHIPWIWLVPPITIGFIILLLKSSYSTISHYLIFLTFALLLYLAAVWTIEIDTQKLVSQLWPISLSGGKLFSATALALLGTIIAPYLIFWQTTEEVESRSTIKRFYQERLGVRVGFIYTAIIALAIMLIASFTFNGQLVNSVNEAAMMLKPFAGNFAYIFFALGIVSSGLIGIPVLAASTAYIGSEILGLPEGLNKKFKQAKGFYILIIGALLIGSIALLARISPMIMLFYTQIINGLLTPILIVFLLLVANNRKIMGKSVNGFGHNFLSIVAIILMLVFAIMWFVL